MEPMSRVLPTTPKLERIVNAIDQKLRPYLFPPEEQVPSELNAVIAIQTLCLSEKRTVLFSGSGGCLAFYPTGMIEINGKPWINPVANLFYQCTHSRRTLDADPRGKEAIALLNSGGDILYPDGKEPKENGDAHGTA